MFEVNRTFGSEVMVNYKLGSSKKSDAFHYNSYTFVCKNAHPTIFSKFT